MLVVLQFSKICFYFCSIYTYAAMSAAIYVHVVSVQYIPMFLMLLSSTICIFYCFYEKINYYRFPLYAAFVFLRYVFYLSMFFWFGFCGVVPRCRVLFARSSLRSPLRRIVLLRSVCVLLLARWIQTREKSLNRRVPLDVVECVAFQHTQ
jgi:hypothetical protein